MAVTKIMVTLTAVGVVMMSIMLPSKAIDTNKVRRLAAKYNVTCVLVFGDSSVDSGNNNRLDTSFKSNFLPYGRDFFGGRPTGRFSDGRLATDFIAEAIGYIKAIPAFLDPELRQQDMVHGVSFASAASGYDDLTANLTNVLALSKQVEYFRQYKIKLSQLVGEGKAEEIIKNALTVLSMGTNDFLQNYYLEPIRPKQYTPEEYQNYLISCMFENIKKMRGLGIGRLVVVGVPPIGCMPLVKTLMSQETCVEEYNKFSSAFNAKIKVKLSTLRVTLGIRGVYADAYGAVQNAMNNPKLYGLKETSKGCCGTGTIEYGDSCRGSSTCSNASEYVFWDAVHPTEKMYKIIADSAVESFDESLLA
ncbi:hypothetical protein SLA2020_043970 [Shorea laevis]